MGWKEIDVVFLTGDEIDRKMAEIAENLLRAEPSAIERADQVAEWVRQREELDVAAKEEKPKRGRGRPKGGTNKPKDNRGKSAQIAHKSKNKPGRPKGTGKKGIAKKLRLSRRDLERSEEIAAIVPEAKSAAVAAGLGDNQSALLQIAAALPEQQADEVAEVVATREEKKAQTRPHGIVADFDQAIAMLERCATCDAETFVSSVHGHKQIDAVCAFLNCVVHVKSFGTDVDRVASAEAMKTKRAALDDAPKLEAVGANNDLSIPDYLRRQ